MDARETQISTAGNWYRPLVPQTTQARAILCIALSSLSVCLGLFQASHPLFYLLLPPCLFALGRLGFQTFAKLPPNRIVIVGVTGTREGADRDEQHQRTESDELKEAHKHTSLFGTDSGPLSWSVPPIRLAVQGFQHA